MMSKGRTYLHVKSKRSVFWLRLVAVHLLFSFAKVPTTDLWSPLQIPVMLYMVMGFITAVTCAP